MSKTKIEWVTRTWNPIAGCLTVASGTSSRRQHCTWEEKVKTDFPDAGDVMHSLLSWLERHDFYELDYTSVCCPQQLSGRTPGGMLFYYRFRHGDGFLIADWRANDLDELITMHLHGEVQIEIGLSGDNGHDGWEPLDALTSVFYLLMAKSSVGAKDEP